MTRSLRHITNTSVDPLYGGLLEQIRPYGALPRIIVSPAVVCSSEYKSVHTAPNFYLAENIFRDIACYKFF